MQLSLLWSINDRLGGGEGIAFPHPDLMPIIQDLIEARMSDQEDLDEMRDN